jgi:spore coat polysaccharide biosynthesis predicted glycosyltransferase SpsG
MSIPNLNMKSLNVLLYADAGAGIGMGHIFRIYPLFECLKRIGYSVQMLVPLTEERLLYLGLHDIHSVSDDPEVIESVIKGINPSLVIIDSYKYINRLCNFLNRNNMCKIAVFDDHQIVKEYVSFIINASPSAHVSQYNHKLTHKFLLGPQYASISQKFINARNNYEIRTSIQKVLVALGGEDTHNNLTFLLDELNSVLDQQINIDVVGSVIKKESQSTRIKYLGWLSHDDLAVHMMEYDLVVLAGGSMLLQAACIGIPTISWPQANGQRNHAAVWEKLDVLIVIEGPQALNNALKIMLNQKKRYEFYQKGRNIVDGNGAERIIGQLISQV